jgi:hypothetical protein
MRTPSRLVLATFAVLTLALPACSKKGNGEGTLGQAGPTVAPPASTTGDTGSTGSTGGTPGTGSVGSTGSTGGSTGGPRSSASIDQFKVTQQPSCPVVGSSDAPFTSPGQSIKLSWNVSGPGVTGVALSIDDPTFFDHYQTGSYGTYGKSGELELAFGCDSTSQPTTTHKYTLNTIGGGPSVSKTLTVSVPTNP